MDNDPGNRGKLVLYLTERMRGDLEALRFRDNARMMRRRQVFFSCGVKVSLSKTSSISSAFHGDGAGKASADGEGRGSQV